MPAPNNYCLLCRTSLRVVAGGEEGATVQVDLSKRASLSRFSIAELRQIYHNATGYEYTGNDYGALLQAAHFAIVRVMNAQSQA